MTLCYRLFLRPGNLREVIDKIGRECEVFGRAPLIKVGYDDPLMEMERIHFVGVSFFDLSSPKIVKRNQRTTSSDEYTGARKAEYDRLRREMERKAEQFSRILKRGGIPSRTLNFYERADAGLQKYPGSFSFGTVGLTVTDID
ncbi:hypothetical protein CMI45_01675 [Candidatus Pacearchaeota archaeon]|nr:hypothetical protein [Candidatus Pacearchaeota archaeon]|tara:strand:- start:194 stop:622 length:429 start_codon:yes stop_codon:yes gene_type:complete